MMPPQQKEAAVAEHDLVALWERHTRFAFGNRDVDSTMATMVEQPYVNHVPARPRPFET